MKSLLFVLSFWAIVSADLPKFPQVRPVDEATQDASLAAVRQEVLTAAKNRNARTLMAFVSPHVKLQGTTANGDGNWRNLDRSLSDKDASDWEDIQRALSLGGAFTTARGAVWRRREFCAPYPYAALPEHAPDELVGDSPWVIIDKDVEVHSSPDARSAVLGQTSYTMVQAAGSERTDPRDHRVVWQTIDLPNDKEAFVLASKIWNPRGYSVCFAQEGGVWLVSAISRFSQP